MTSPAFLTKCRPAQIDGPVDQASTGSAGLASSTAANSISVCVGVVLAEQQLGSRGQLRADLSGGAAAIAAISPGQFGAGQSCGHGSSVSALLPNGL